MEELQEESEVGQDDEGCEDKVAKVNWTTLTAMKVPKGQEVDSSVDNHLYNLKAGYDCSDSPRNLDPERLECVVGVHDRVDHVVHHHEPADIGGEVAEAVEDGYEHAEVVVPVKEDEFLFPEDNEGGVPELEQLGQGEQPGPEGGDFIGLQETWVTDGSPQAFA